MKSLQLVESLQLIESLQPMRGRCCKDTQRGAVLIVTLLVLLLLAIIATAVAQTNLLQLHMAANDEAKTAALQQAMAGVDAVLDQPGGMPVSGGVGYRVCAGGSADERCDATTIILDDAVMPATGTLEYAVTRVAPLLGRMPVMSEDRASSGVHYRVAKFEVMSSYDGVAEGQGKAVVVQGVLVRLAASAHQPDGTPGGDK